jgi:hypothetical protein
VPVKKELKVSANDWKLEMEIKEGETLQLDLTVNKSINNPEEVCLFKNGQVVKQTENVVISVIKTMDEVTNEEKSEVVVAIKNVKPEDSGEYKLTLKENSDDQQLAGSKLKVNPTSKPVIKCLNPLKSDKPDLVQGDELVLLFKFSQVIENSDDCILWELNRKILDLNDERIEKVEDILENGEYQCTLKISNVQVGIHDGEYSVKIKQTPDSNDLLYSGSTKVSIKPKPLEINDSNWQHDMSLKEGEQLELNLSINRDMSDSENIVLRKNGAKLAEPNIKTTLVDGKTEIQVLVTNVSGSDSADYTLSLENASKKQKIELASTHLGVAESPLEILEPLKTDKLEYLVGEDVTFSLTTTKPVENKDKCIEWLLNDKPLSINNNPKVEFCETKKVENNSVVYTLTIKDAQLGKNDGEYTIKIK